ncbi:MAG: Ig domain-containing protein [Planctomycetia bacterium]
MRRLAPLPHRILLRPRLLLPVLLLLLALGACGGGGSAARLAFLLDPAAYRVGEPIAPNTASATGCTVTSYSVSPPLPAGLVLDPATGAITGMPTAEAGWQAYRVTAAHAGGSVAVDIDLAVGAALPAEVGSLAAGFVAERVATGLAFPS